MDGLMTVVIGTLQMTPSRSMYWRAFLRFYFLRFTI